MKKLQAGDAEITYDNTMSQLTFKGSMRLANMKEYDVVSEFLKEASEHSTDKLILNLEQLKFLNSSGITTLSLFILNCKKKNNLKITVQGNNDISWQQKSISNFQKLWNDVEIVI